MTRTNRSALNTTTAGAVLVAAFLLSMPSPAEAHHLEKHFSVKPHPVVIVHNPTGMITVNSWNKPEVLVVADNASSLVEVDAVQKENLVELITHLLSESAGPDDLRADYHITVPEDAELQIHNDAGSVAVAKILGDTAVETATAGVALEDIAGYLTVKTIGGSVDCLRCTGRIEISSFSGNLHLLQDRSSHIRAQTSRGNILFDSEFLPNGTYLLKNYSGVIEVRFSPVDSFSLSATSLRGKVNNEASLIPPEHSTHLTPRFGKGMFGSLNQGRARVELSSFDGTIDIRKRN